MAFLCECRRKIYLCWMFYMYINAINHSTIKQNSYWMTYAAIKKSILLAKPVTWVWENGFMWNSASGADFKASLGRRTKKGDLSATRPRCRNPIICRTFIGVSSDQWKNGAAAVGTHTLTSVDISSSQPLSSNTFFSQLWWQMLFIEHFSCLITAICLSLYPYLQSKVIKLAPISSLYHCEQMLF